VSLKEVAAHAGVSFQTAGKVLNGGTVRVAAATAERIQHAARELGYSPNTVARGLVRRSTTTIGLVAGSLRDPALAEFVIGAELAARCRGHSVLVSNLTGDAGEGVGVVRSLVERRVDGIIAAAPELEEDEAVGELLRRYVPCVSLHHVPGGGVPRVGSDHREVGRLAAGHLVAGAREVVGTVAGPFGRRVVQSRLRGAAERLRAAELETGDELVSAADWSPAGGASATQRLLGRAPRLDAVFVHSDLMAVGVLDALAAAGRRIPDDVAVVSCDDLPFAAYLRPALSTVRIPFHETGREAVELLLRQIRGEAIEPAPRLLPVELVVRDSSSTCAPVRSRSGKRQRHTRRPPDAAALAGATSRGATSSSSPRTDSSGAERSSPGGGGTQAAGESDREEGTGTTDRDNRTGSSRPRRSAKANTNDETKDLR
jgi:LacI family transcriptional regulator